MMDFFNHIKTFILIALEFILGSVLFLSGYIDGTGAYACPIRGAILMYLGVGFLIHVMTKNIK